MVGDLNSSKKNSVKKSGLNVHLEDESYSEQNKKSLRPQVLPLKLYPILQTQSYLNYVTFVEDWNGERSLPPRLVCASNDTTIHINNVMTGQNYGRIGGHTDRILCMAISELVMRNNNHIHIAVTGSRDQVMCIKKMYDFDGSFVSFLDSSSTEQLFDDWKSYTYPKQSGKTMWVLQCPQLTYFSWKNYLPNTTGIARKNIATNPIYKNIFPYKTALHFKEQEGLKIIKVRGKWAKIGFSTELSPHLNQYVTLPKGWIKWRDEEDLLIQYFLR